MTVQSTEFSVMESASLFLMEGKILCVSTMISDVKSTEEKSLKLTAYSKFHWWWYEGSKDGGGGGGGAG